MPAKYTVILRDLMNNEMTKALIDKALSNYPLYAPATTLGELATLIPTREELNKKLLNHYKYREIGFETVGRFLDELEISMDEIMPHYNQLYKSIETMVTIEDPFANVDIIEEYIEQRKDTTTSTGTINEATTSTGTTNEATTSTGTTNAASSNTGTNTSKIVSSDNTETSSQVSSNNKTVKSDTPQDDLDISDIDSVTYANEAVWNRDTANNTGTSKATSQSDTTTTTEASGTADTTTAGQSELTGELSHTFTKKGNQGVNTYAHDMNELRETFIDVTNRIINDERISELFMRVF